MKLKNYNNFKNNQLIHLKDYGWLKKQKHAGRCVANILKECGDLINKKTPNLNLLDFVKLTDDYMKVYDCVPTFLNYKGFPAPVCISVNNQLVHGIPSDYVLQEGDIVSIDLGATYDGVISDAARTWIYGQPKSNEHVRLLETCWKALLAGIKAIEVGKYLGVIGYAINNVAKNSEFGLITKYGGHGINYNTPHAQPFVSNKSQATEGIIIQEGLSIAIEPMLVIGDTQTTVSHDGWTVFTNGVGAHFENSVTIIDNNVHIITELNEDKEWFKNYQ